MNSFARLLLIAGVISATSPLMAQTADDILEQGREAYLEYRFSEAASLYANAKKKFKKPTDEFLEKYNRYHQQLTMAENFLSRVEKIAIIDSITVPRDEFFKAYRIPASSGSLRGAEALPSRLKYVDYVFTNEGEDYKLWAQPDSTGYYRIVESSLLTDGSWSEPTALSDDLAEEGDEIYPFMLADGVTLYYADNGENSIGGYDIMVATRDAADGSFLQPQNMGFPYNSPFDDYLLVIDELNGVGWWATDRNQLDDELTIYVFVTNDMRVNYDADDDNLESFARIDDYIATQPEDSDYDDLLATIHAIDPMAKTKKAEFHIPAANGKIYTRFEELPTAKLRASAKHFLEARKNLSNLEKSLKDMRMKYHRNPSQDLGRQIASLEKRVDLERSEFTKIKSAFYKELLNK